MRSSLLCVKSIMTLLVTAAFCALCFMYPETYTDTMKTVIVAVITFYFSHQIDKANRGGLSNVQTENDKT